MIPTTDPGRTDPGRTDPGSTDPGSTGPGSTGPGPTGPGPWRGRARGRWGRPEVAPGHPRPRRGAACSARVIFRGASRRGAVAGRGGVKESQVKERFV
ncbi:hypothetical protein E0E62_24555 [Streptomyces sp. 16-176A]